MLNQRQLDLLNSLSDSSELISQDDWRRAYESRRGRITNMQAFYRDINELIRGGFVDTIQKMENVRGIQVGTMLYRKNLDH